MVCGAHEEDIPHIFVDDHYSVSGIKAYLNKVCSCGKTMIEELEAETFVIVTPSTVQVELDKNINGKIIIFSSGNYDEVIYIRSSGETTTTYSFISTTERVTSVISNEDVKNGDAKTQYHYFRNIQNVKFVGVEVVVISNMFSFYTGPVGYSSVNHLTVLSYDEVKQIDFSQTSTSAFASYSHINIKNITIENLSFTTDNGMISVYYKTIENSTENFTVKNCKLKNTTDTKTKRALQITARDFVGIIKNVTFENNIVDGYFKALEIVAFENATVKGNTIVNCKHNGISLFGGNVSGKEQRMKGTIIVEDNIFTNVTNHPIKIFYGQDCVVNIKNNVINNYQHSGNYLIEVLNISDTKEGVYSTLTFVNNTYNWHTYMDILNDKINELGNTDEDDYIALYIRHSQFIN